MSANKGRDLIGLSHSFGPWSGLAPSLRRDRLRLSRRPTRRNMRARRALVNSRSHTSRSQTRDRYQKIGTGARACVRFPSGPVAPRVSQALPRHSQRRPTCAHAPPDPPADRPAPSLGLGLETWSAPWCATGAPRGGPGAGRRRPGGGGGSGRGPGGEAPSRPPNICAYKFAAIFSLDRPGNLHRPTTGPPRGLRIVKPAECPRGSPAP
jgi:hypothetical protein